MKYIFHLRCFIAYRLPWAALGERRQPHQWLADLTGLDNHTMSFVCSALLSLGSLWSSHGDTDLVLPHPHFRIFFCSCILDFSGGAHAETCYFQRCAFLSLQCWERWISRSWVNQTLIIKRKDKSMWKNKLGRWEMREGLALPTWQGSQAALPMVVGRRFPAWYFHIHEHIRHTEARWDGSFWLLFSGKFHAEVLEIWLWLQTWNLKGKKKTPHNYIYIYI